MSRIALRLAILCALAWVGPVWPALAMTVFVVDDVPTATAWGTVLGVVTGLTLALAYWSVRARTEARQSLSCWALMLVLVFVTGPAYAGTACPQFYLDGQPPATVDAPADTRELCNRGYVVLWNPATRDPVFAAEHLTAKGLAAKVKRVGRFFPDPRLIPDGAVRADYQHQRRFDQGHMRPAADASDALEMHESFSLANAVPQDKWNNEHSWAQIEEGVRSLIVPFAFDRESTDAWVVTGPIFDEPLRLLRGRVAIPDRLFKAVYVKGDPARHLETTVGAFIVANARDPKTRFVSIAALQSEIGVDPFPTLPAELREKALLPVGVRNRTGVEDAY